MEINNKRRIFKNRRGQEEIVGFVVIVVIVVIILLFFLVFSLTSEKDIPESYEAASFLQAALTYTTGVLRGDVVYPAEAAA